MNTRTIIKRRRPWAWPDYDTELIRVFDQVDDLDIIVSYCTRRKVAIQAGGACGVWPYYLAEHFDWVNTFEPDVLNFHCLKANLGGELYFKLGKSYVDAFHAALGARRGFCRVRHHPSEENNAGAGYIEPGGRVPVITIDDLDLHACDLVQLDVEGAEVDALLGGYMTIRAYQPTIVIEEKQLPQDQAPADHLRARKLLESWGYRERDRVHRDVIFTC